MRCEAVADRVAGVADESSDLDDAEREHIDGCLRCQAELVRYRRLARTLRSLRDQRLGPIDGLFDEILAVLDDPDLLRSTGRSGRRAAYLSGLAAAGAAGAIVIATRARSRRLVG